jgi:hypothetical protein
MSNVAWLQTLLNQAFATLDFSSLADHLADDVDFEVTPPGGCHTTPGPRGRQAVIDYLTSLGDIVTFWQVQCFGEGERVVAVGAESFTIPRSGVLTPGVTLGSEFALLLNVCDRVITRFFIIEDLSESSALEEPALEEV